MRFLRRAAAVAIALLVLSPADAPRAQAAVPPIDQSITYILPQWGGFYAATDLMFADEVAQLRSRIGEGRRVRVGFTVYATVYMSPVEPTDAAAVRAALAPTLEQMDFVLARARQHGIPVCISFLTAIRSWTDQAQAADQAADRRTMQWHSDNSLAPGWATLSRYARVQQARQEAFLRELGRQIAARMMADPDTFVAASGDGEVELSFDRSVQRGNAPTEAASLVADYSPFAVAEFRDWLRGAGMYGAGQPFAGEAYVNAARYAGDATPADLNADFGQTFATWNLEHFDWSLSDLTSPDPNAIPSSTYDQAGWPALAVANASGFDAPRTRQPADAWWQVWDLFRQTMVWRYNRQFAKWITTSPDAATGATVPAARWFSDQIPADYLFGFTPANPDLRLATSASPWWTADISPYGSLGITSFNQRNADNGFVARTLPGVAPQIAQRGVRWGIFEWNPSVPASPDIEDYRQEMTLVERYRPSLLAPFFWNDPDYRIKDTGFEVALRELVLRLNAPPLRLNPASIEIGAVAGTAAQTPPQIVRVSGFAGESPVWAITAVSPMFTAQMRPDGRSFSVALAGTNVPAGTYAGAVTVTPATAGYGPATLTVTARITSPRASTPPVGFIDTPLANATVAGEVGMTGWAVDDVGISGVDIYRSPLAGEATHPNGFVLIGPATLVEGSRPDVAAAYPTRPLNRRAGWGLMLLTNMLPNRGNGNFTLHAYARDYDGYTTLLGSRAILSQNSTSHLPFGTIDTPLQGETVSGTIVNFGWALTPQPNFIPRDGSTIGVYIDDVFVGRPTYNNLRDDIASLFPGYSNADGAVGFFMIDTTTLANGVHTIAWGVTDSARNAQGLGSRYFTVANP